jgi:ferrous iron transport protein B
MGTAILTSFAAREVFVSSMAILYRVEETGSEEETRNVLRDQLAASKWPGGRPIFTPLSLISLLVFFIYALQCLPTSAVVARESGSWKWAAGQFIFMTGFAYVASLVVFQTGKLFGL